jgi:transposase-like protein
VGTDLRAGTVRDRDGARVAARPDRGRCTGCDATHVILDAGLVPGRAYAAGLIGRALASAANGHGHRRIARESRIPDGTVRGWIRRARRSAGQLRAIGVRAVVALDPGTLPARVLADPLASALDALGAAAVAMGRRLGLHDAGLWPRIVLLTRGRLLSLAPDS